MPSPAGHNSLAARVQAGATGMGVTWAGRGAGERANTAHGLAAAAGAGALPSAFLKACDTWAAPLEALTVTGEPTMVVVLDGPTKVAESLTVFSGSNSAWPPTCCRGAGGGGAEARGTG
jgi:hypothetical protein